MTRHYQAHTFEALAFRADHVEDLDSLAHILGGDDHRSVQAFYIDTEADFDFGLDDSERLPAGELIGIVIGGDDPHFAGEVLDRDQACDLFGAGWVDDREAARSYYLQVNA